MSPAKGLPPGLRAHSGPRLWCWRSGDPLRRSGLECGMGRGGGSVERAAPWHVACSVRGLSAAQASASVATLSWSICRHEFGVRNAGLSLPAQGVWHLPVPRVLLRVNAGWRVLYTEAHATPNSAPRIPQGTRGHPHPPPPTRGGCCRRWFDNHTRCSRPQHVTLLSDAVTHIPSVLVQPGQPRVVSALLGFVCILSVPGTGFVILCESGNSIY